MSCPDLLASAICCSPNWCMLRAATSFVLRVVVPCPDDRYSAVMGRVRKAWLLRALLESLGNSQGWSGLGCHLCCGPAHCQSLQKEPEAVILRLIVGDLQGLFGLLLSGSCCGTARVVAVGELWINISLNGFNVTRFSSGFAKQVLICERKSSVKRISLFPPPAISSFSLPPSSAAWRGNLNAV